jgi:hypothetical protein
VLLAAVYKLPGHAWNDADIIQLLSFRRKLLLAGDLNAKLPFWNRLDSNPSCEKLLNLVAYKWVRNSCNTLSHSLRSCGKWWRGRYCCAQKCPTVESHCLWHSGLRSPTNHFPLTGSWYN